MKQAAQWSAPARDFAGPAWLPFWSCAWNTAPAENQNATQTPGNANNALNSKSGKYTNEAGSTWQQV
jgi:hypothetical protein